MKLEEKIKEKLNAYGLCISDLSSEELEALKEEIKAEERGEYVIDGVLSNILPYGKSVNENND